MRIALLGATGLVGKEFLSLALRSSNVESIIVYVRRPLNEKHLPELRSYSQKLKVIVGELKDLKNHGSQLTADRYVCAIGTTIKTAGSQEAFRQVDHDSVVEFARIAKQHHGKLVVVSALGADAQSSIFYSRTKGEMENDVKSLLGSDVCFVRPSLLLGNREEFRLGERVGALFQYLPIWIGPLKKYRPIEASEVAQQLFKKVAQ